MTVCRLLKHVFITRHKWSLDIRFNNICSIYLLCEFFSVNITSKYNFGYKVYLMLVKRIYFLLKSFARKFDVGYNTIVFLIVDKLFGRNRMEFSPPQNCISLLSLDSQSFQT